jgi:hypothetical protein
LISSAFGLACSGAAPPPAAPPKLSARKDKIEKILSQRKNAKILKNFFNPNGAPVGTSSDCLLADECAIKKDNL